MKRNLILFFLVAFIFTACAGMTATEVGGTVVAGTGALVGMIEALKPMLSPEQYAKLQATAVNVQDIVQATTTAVGAVADSIGKMKADLDATKAAEWTTGEKVAAAGGIVSAAIGGAAGVIQKVRGPTEVKRQLMRNGGKT